MSIAWKVMLNGEQIDTVFYDDNCDRAYVKHGLVEHDGLDPAIELERDVGMSDREFKANKGSRCPTCNSTDVWVGDDEEKDLRVISTRGCCICNTTWEIEFQFAGFTVERLE